MPLKLFLVAILFFYACSPSKQISRSAQKEVINDPSLQSAHVGISIFDPAKGKYIYNYQGDKFFVPASNIKIPTCYVAMKYLGDSLPGLKVGFSKDSTLIGIQPTGDPSFLHPDFIYQPSFDYLRKQAKKGKYRFALSDNIWKDERWGNGWSWNDYDASYMAERNSFPVFGNVFTIRPIALEKRDYSDLNGMFPKIKLFQAVPGYFDEAVNEANYRNLPKEVFYQPEMRVQIRRKIDENDFLPSQSSFSFKGLQLPFVTNGAETTMLILEDSLQIKMGTLYPDRDDVPKVVGHSMDISPSKRNYYANIDDWQTIYSQPTDSILKPMMHRSDNFFAEQMLLMVSNQLLGVMNVQQVVDSIMKTDFSDLPQRPRWADGSGLSRYNLFTPQDMVSILHKMEKEFGMERIKEIFPTGNEGTLRNYYVAEEGLLYAKTGTLSGVVAISGFLQTSKGQPLIFSVLVNNHRAAASDVRRAVEKFLQRIQKLQ